MCIKGRALGMAMAASLTFPAVAQAPVAQPPDIAAALGDVGDGWTRRSGGREGVTYVCDAALCGGRGVLGVSQTRASSDYIKAVVSDPEKALPGYRYGSDESMKPSGCIFTQYEIKRHSDRRVHLDSHGGCPDGSFAAMTTVFDLGRPNIVAVQVLTKSESLALSLRNVSTAKVNAALDGNIPARLPGSR